jgi:hypothetical protein
VTEYVRATWLQPAEGGECEDIEWDIADIDEVLGWLELESEGVENMLRGFFKIMGRLPQLVVDKIDSTWNIEDAAHEAAADYDPRDDYDEDRRDDD